MTLRFDLSPSWHPRRLLWIAPALIAVTAGFYGLAFGRVVVNATSSLPDNAYLMVTWPQSLSRGAVIAAELPPVLRSALGTRDLYLTKRIVGVAGDPVTRDRNRICINEACVDARIKHGAPILPLWEVDFIPEGAVAVFGDSADSLDSRYDVIGAVPVETIVASGISIPFPHWKQLQEWLQ